MINRRPLLKIEYGRRCVALDAAFTNPLGPEAAAANLNPWTEAKVDTKNPDRGPLLIISGEKDHTVPPAISNASYHQQRHNENVTEIAEILGRGHSLVIDNGWR